MGPDAITLIAAAPGWLAGLMLLRRIAGAGPAPSKSPAHATISIIIPARDEEETLPGLLGSIAEQSLRPLEVIVVDDGSTDQTPAVANRLGATVLPSRSLPAGWRGKTWACQQGAQQARGELLLFLDADTWFETDGLQSILEAYRGGALSVGPYHVVHRPYEQLSAFFNTIMTVATIPHGLFGQMLLIDRLSYRQIGGHEAVKGRVLENLFLAERCAEAGIPARSIAGKGVFSFRMYRHGLRELVEGWTKGFAAGARKTPRPLLLLIILWLIGMISAIGSLAHWPWPAVLYALCAGQIFFLFRKVGTFHWASALFYPVPLLFYLAVFARSAVRTGGTVTWKGRTFRAD